MLFPHTARLAVYQVHAVTEGTDAQATVSVRLQWGPRRDVVMATVGHNIFERSSWSDVGHTMSLFGGGGHRGAGSCPLPPDDGDATLRRLVSELKRQG